MCPTYVKNLSFVIHSLPNKKKLKTAVLAVWEILHDTIVSETAIKAIYPTLRYPHAYLPRWYSVAGRSTTNALFFSDPLIFELLAAAPRYS